MSKRLTVELQIREGTSADFEEMMMAATARVRAEDSGCEQYNLFKALDRPTRYVLLESWASDEDLEAHMSSAAMEQVRGMSEYFASPPVVHRYED